MAVLLEVSLIKKNTLIVRKFKHVQFVDIGMLLQNQ